MKKSWSNRIRSYLVRAVNNHFVSRAAGKARLVILIYHRILERPDPLMSSEPDIASFRWQMEALASNFHVLALGDALDKLRSGTLPQRAVCITFDDGYRSTHDRALPILKQLGLRATVFITTRHLDGSNMWNDRIMHAIRTMPDGVLNLRDAGLGQYLLSAASDRASIATSLIGGAKYMSSADRMALTTRIESLAGLPLQDGLMLSEQMVKNLINNGFDVGGHTVTHPILAKLDDSLAQHEIVQCKLELEAITGRPVRFFAYPNGKVGIDYDERHVQMAKQAGYEAAFITTIGSVSTTTDLFQVPRGRPWDKSSLLFQLRIVRWLAQRD